MMMVAPARRGMSETAVEARPFDHDGILVPDPGVVVRTSVQRIVDGNAVEPGPYGSQRRGGLRSTVHDRAPRELEEIALIGGNVRVHRPGSDRIRRDPRRV